MELYLVNEMSYVFDIIIKKLLRWNGESEPFVCQEKRKKKRKGGCNRQLIALPFTKNSPLFRFKRIHSISKLISFGFSTLHSPWIPSFCDFSTILLIDCDRNAIKTLEKFWILGIRRLNRKLYYPQGIF